ncbi:hypothetical protein PHSC3_000245 [Chlamydiales bacterium STE3]|nr:hypothetical protein PHSC3_000245 [Chlamydiales bacterium STE3]
MQSYCDQVNRQPRNRGIKYEELLKYLSKADRSQLTPEGVDDLSRNLLTLIQKIPDDVKKRESIKKALEKICFFHPTLGSLNVLKNFCLHVNESVGIRTHVYEIVLGLIQSSLPRIREFQDLESLGRCFTLIKHYIPSDIKKENNLKKAILNLEKHQADLLKRYCFFINKRENPIRSYWFILNAIIEATKFQTTIEELHRLSQNLTLIIQLIPMRHKQEIEECINEAKWHLASSYRLHHFIPLKRELRNAEESSKVNILTEEIRFIDSKLPAELDPNLKKEVEKCLKFSNRKFLIRYFVESRQNAVRGQDTLHSSSTSEVIESTRLQERRIYPILSIDGGGLRGIIPATVLVQIERITNKPISSLFQMIGGTSTGGILTLGLTKPHPDGSGLPEYSAQDLLNLYAEEHGQIFRQNPSYREDLSDLKLVEKVQEAIRNPKYITPDLFQERFHDSLLSSALTDVVITANTEKAIISKVYSISLATLTGFISFGTGLLGYEPTSIFSHDSIPRKVHLFTRQGLKKLSYSLGKLEGLTTFPRRYSYPARLTEPVPLYSISRKGRDFFMADIAKVTSAAPSYFPGLTYDEQLFVDGGVLQNNPSIPCVLEALNRGQKKDNLFMVSLGTGVEPLHKPKANLGASLASLWFETTQPHVQEDCTLRNMLNLGACHRFQYHFENHAPDLDDTSPETINKLQASGQELVEENIDHIREVCKVLSPESI